jgi:transcriptional regulator with XRE-family HTH domain
MTGPEFRAALKTLGIRQNWLATKLGVSNVTVWRWANGDLPVPQYAITVLELYAKCKALETGSYERSPSRQPRLSVEPSRPRIE